MVSNCWICKISYKSSVKRSYHKFPRDEIMRQKWFVASGMTEAMYNDRRRICSDHFQKSDYDHRDGKRNFLLATAVPNRDYNAFALGEYVNGSYDAEYHGSNERESESYNLEEESQDVIINHLALMHSEESNSEFLNDNTNTSTLSQVSSSNIYREVGDQILYVNDSNESDSYSQIERRKSSKPSKHYEMDSLYETTKRRLEDKEDVLHKRLCVEMSEKRIALNRTDVTSDKAWNLYLKYRQTTQRQKNFLSHKCVQLDKNLYNLKRLLDNLRNKRLEVSI